MVVLSSVTWKWKSLSLSDSLWPHGLYRVHGILQARILEWVTFPFSRGSSQPRNPTQVSCFAGRFFASWATWEAQEYWSGKPTPSAADLPTQESNRGLLHCRRILYQLRYEGTSMFKNMTLSTMRAYFLSRFSRVQLFGTLWTVTHQALLSIGFSRQGYWIGLPCTPPGDLPA